MLLTHYRVLYTQQERVDQEDVRINNQWLKLECQILIG